MAEFPLELKHIAGKKNRADPLSRRPDYDDGSKDNEGVVALPESLFIKAIETEGLDQMIATMQEQRASEMNKWKEEHHLRRDKQGWYHKGIALVVPEDSKLRRDLVELNHDSPTVAHPGIDKTHKLLLKQYWWPGCKEFVQQYVKGCAICQANKPITHQNNPPLHPITPQEETLPFQTIAIDFIVKLPTSEGYDLIMMITDHDCTKAVILVPCQETIDAEGVAKLFKDRVFPFVGLPKKIISDRDPHFTSAFFKELCKQLEISQNLSTAYHPQTDGQSEKTNQHVETALRIYCNYQQNDWAHWLPIVQYAINARPSAMTKQAPYKLWMGFIPRAHQAECSSKVPTIELHREQIREARKQALEAMKRAQELLGCKSTHRPYQKGQKVWLEGTNLHTTHPTVKLCPKHYGPFKVIEAIGLTTYRLELPAQWKIHNAFHGSLLLPYHETKEHGANFPEPAPELIEGQPGWEVEKILNSRRYRGKKQYLIKWKGYSDTHNSWEPKENVTAPTLLAAYHERNTAAVRKLETEQADCGQRTLSLDSKRQTAKALLQRQDKRPLDSKGQTDERPLDSKGQSKALNPDNCAQYRNRHVKKETKAQPAVPPRKKTGFVQRLRAILLRPIRKANNKEKTTEEQEECECSICKRNKGAAQGATEPNPPALMTIRSIRIDQKKHRTPTLGAIQEEGPPNRRTPENGLEEATEMAKGGQSAEQQTQDKRLTETGEETSSPLSLIPHTAPHPHMHGSPKTYRLRCFICRNTDGSASSPMTVSGVDTARMPPLPRTPPKSAAVEAAPILSEALRTTPPAPIPATTTSTDTRGAYVIRRAHEEPSSTSAEGASSSEETPAHQDTSRHPDTAEDPQTSQPLNHDDTAVVVRLPQHPSYLVPNAGPVTRTCRSSPRPQNIILHAPCDLSLPWINQLTFHYAGVYRMHNEYRPVGREADLWGYLVNLERTGYDVMWGPPTNQDIAEHEERVRAVKRLGRLIDKVPLKFGCTTRCCVIHVGCGSKFNTRCIHGERPLFQGRGLSHTVEVRAPTHVIIAIPLATKEQEALRKQRLMARCVEGWLHTGQYLPTRIPYVGMLMSRWEHFAHDLARYVAQTKRLALENRGVHWTPTPEEKTS